MFTNPSKEDVLSWNNMRKLCHHGAKALIPKVIGNKDSLVNPLCPDGLVANLRIDLSNKKPRQGRAIRI